jgi:predicted small lipoprotein YifL
VAEAPHPRLLYRIGYSAPEFRRTTLEVSRRAGLLPALAICLFALTLGACGVKGALEPPPGAKKAASDAAGEGETVGLREKVFVERSQVKRVGTPPIIPKLPPKEWEKDGDSKKDDSPGSERALKRNTPDKPFVLDWLL